MRISKLQSIFVRFFKEGYTSDWVVKEIEKIKDKNKITPKSIEDTLNKVCDLAEKYPYQYQLDGVASNNPNWYRDLAGALNSKFSTNLKYNGQLI